MSAMTLHEAMQHARGENPIDAEDRAKQMMPHYLFVLGNEKHREGWCTACERWVDCSTEAMKRTPTWVHNDPYLDDRDETYPFIPFQIMPEYEFERRYSGRTLHNDTGYCPECGERVTFKNIGRGYRGLHDHRFFFRWQKSSVSPFDTLVGIGYDVRIPWGEFDPYNPEVPIRLEEREICVIEYGRGGDRFINMMRWCDMGGWDMSWDHRRECKSGWAPGVSYQNGVQTILDAESFESAVHGTPFEQVLEATEAVQYCDAGTYYDRITVLERIARYPCIEYMAKLGFDGLARAVIDKQTHGVLNLRGKTARSVLRLTQDEWGEVKGKKLHVTINMLLAKAWCREHKVRLNMEMCGVLGSHINWHQTVREIMNIDCGTSLPKAIKYCIRKCVRLSDWKDQLQMMRFLQMDIHDREWRYPKDFQKSHQELNRRWNAVLKEQMQKQKAAKQTEQNEKIVARLGSGELDEYFFSANGLVLRPMLSAAEIILEGSRQGHCVAGYVNTYANGNDVLCVLRYENQMDKPLYTVEFDKNGELIQCRACHNGEGPVPQKERDAFWRLHDLMRKDLKTQKAKDEKAKKRKETAA